MRPPHFSYRPMPVTSPKTEPQKPKDNATPVAAPNAPVPGRRQLGVKEPIIFKWKLIGDAHDAVLTLYKSVEREDTEAQFNRLQGDVLYKNLRILDIDAKIVQPKAAKAFIKNAVAVARKKTALREAAKAKKAVPAKPAVAKKKTKAVVKIKAKKKVAKKAKKKAAKKSPEKKTVRKAKKAAPAKRTPKRSAKKK